MFFRLYSDNAHWNSFGVSRNMPINWWNFIIDWLFSFLFASLSLSFSLSFFQFLSLVPPLSLTVYFSFFLLFPSLCLLFSSMPIEDPITCVPIHHLYKWVVWLMRMCISFKPSTPGNKQQQKHSACSQLFFVRSSLPWSVSKLAANCLTGVENRIIKIHIKNAKYYVHSAICVGVCRTIWIRNECGNCELRMLIRVYILDVYNKYRFHEHGQIRWMNIKHRASHPTTVQKQTILMRWIVCRTVFNVRRIDMDALK